MRLILLVFGAAISVSLSSCDRSDLDNNTINVQDSCGNDQNCQEDPAIQENVDDNWNTEGVNNND